MVGTPDYLAPEQAVNSRSADIRSDLYSLGCTLYFLLTGRPPFSGESLAQVLLQHQMAEAPALAALRPGLSPGLQAVVRRMMEKQPGRRFQRPDEVAAALEPFARGEGAALSVPALPPTAVDDTGETWATLGGEDDGLVKAPGAGAGTRRRSSPEERPAPRRSGRQKEKKEEPKSKVGLYSLIAAGVGVPVLGLILTLALLPGRKDAAGPAGPPVNGTDDLAGQAGPKPAEQAPLFAGLLEGEVAAVGGAAVSPDGKRCACATPARSVRLHDLRTGKVLHTFQGLPGFASSLAFSADGKRLVAASAGRIFEWASTPPGRAAASRSPWSSRRCSARCSRSCSRRPTWRPGAGACRC